MDFANEFQYASNVHVTAEMFLKNEGVSRKVFRDVVNDSNYNISSNNRNTIFEEKQRIDIEFTEFEKDTINYLKAIWIDNQDPDIFLEKIFKEKGSNYTIVLGKAADFIERRHKCRYGFNSLTKELKNEILENVSIKENNDD